MALPTVLHELCFAAPLSLQEGFLDEPLGTHLSSVAEEGHGIGAPPEDSAPLGRGALRNLAVADAVRGSLAANLVFKYRLFFGVALPVPGRALPDVVVAAGLSENPLG